MSFLFKDFVCPHKNRLLLQPCKLLARLFAMKHGLLIIIFYHQKVTCHMLSFSSFTPLRSTSERGWNQSATEMVSVTDSNGFSRRLNHIHSGTEISSVGRPSESPSVL